MKYAAFDRFVVPLDSPAALRYLATTLRVPHSARERFRAAIRPARLPLELREPGERQEATELLFDALEDRQARRRAIVLHDYDDNGRGRVIAFLFRDGMQAPYAVAKARSTAAGGEALRREADALATVRRMIPAMQSSVPEVLQFESSSRGEVLVVSALHGCSAYVEMQRSLLPRRHLLRHFAAAAAWLAAFHEATRQSDRTAVHGDFWPRNVLHGEGGLTGVVDWEHFEPSGSPYVDLFHYPLTYGIAYGRTHLRQRSAIAAFEETFLQRTPLSRAVRAYLERYATRRSETPAGLRAAFERYLATRGAMSAQRAPHPGVAALPWDRFEERFRNARYDLFS